MRRWLPGVSIAIAFVLSSVALPRLPAAVTLDLGLLLPFAVEGESGPRAWFAFGLPTIALALWLFFLVATSPAGVAAQQRVFGRWAPPETLEPRSIARFRSTYDLVVALVIAFVLLFHLTLVALAAGGPPSIVRAFLLLVGLGLAAMGNVMPRLRPNPIMGIRTRATLTDPALWARMHRLFGGLLLASGVLVMLLALVAVQYALIGLVAALALSCVTVFVVHANLPHPTGIGRVVP
jgi:immunity protein, SdpI family